MGEVILKMFPARESSAEVLLSSSFAVSSFDFHAVRKLCVATDKVQLSST